MIMIVGGMNFEQSVHGLLFLTEQVKLRFLVNIIITTKILQRLDEKYTYLNICDIIAFLYSIADMVIIYNRH